VELQREGSPQGFYSLFLRRLGNKKKNAPFCQCILGGETNTDRDGQHIRLDSLGWKFKVEDPAEVEADRLKERKTPENFQTALKIWGKNTGCQAERAKK